MNILYYGECKELSETLRNPMSEKNQNILIVLIYAIVVSIAVPFIPQIIILPASLVGLICGLAVIPILIFNWRRKK